MTKLKHFPYLILIFITAFWLRTYRLDYPLADWHSWRQADTASVTRNFIKQGFTPFFPKFDSLITLNWRYENDNPDRYFFAEFPIYNILVYPLYKMFGVNIIYHRLVSIFFSSLTCISLFFLAKHYSNTTTAYFSSIIFALLPFNIYYGRVTMPDPLHIFFSTTALLYISIWLTKRRPTNLLTASFFLALTFLTKPYSLVLLLPVLIIILVNNYPTKYIKNTSIILFFILSLLPYILWKIHIDHYPQGQFDTDWLFNSTAIRFKPAFFRWIFYERFSNLILGSGGFVLLILGFISPKSPKESLFYYSWLVSLLVFVTIIATGNITHDYYQLPFIPLFSILVAKGIVYLLIIGKNFYQKIFNFSIACFLFIMMLSIGWYNTQGFFNVNNWSIVKAGQAADQIIPANGLVIAPYNRDPAFLYQTNRYGWTQPVEDIDKLINTYPNPIYLVSTTKDDYTAKVVSVGQVVDETQEYIIVKIK